MASEQKYFKRLVGGLFLLAQWLRCQPGERKIRGSNPTCDGIFPGSSHIGDFKIGTPVATLPGTWRCRVSAGTGRPGVNILWLGEVESLICNFYLSVPARLSRSVPEIHWHVAGTLSSQPITTILLDHQTQRAYDVRLSRCKTRAGVHYCNDLM